MGIAIANRKNRCDSGALSIAVEMNDFSGVIVLAAMVAFNRLRAAQIIREPFWGAKPNYGIINYPAPNLGNTPSTAGTFWKKFRKIPKDPGNALRAFPGIPLESTAGMPQTL